MFCWEEEAQSASVTELCSFDVLPCSFSSSSLSRAGCLWRKGTLSEEIEIFETFPAWLGFTFGAGHQRFPPLGPFRSLAAQFLPVHFSFLALCSRLRRTPQVSAPGLCKRSFSPLQKRSCSFPSCSRYAKWSRVIV